VSKIMLSITPYNDDSFEVFIRDDERGIDIALPGKYTYYANREKVKEISEKIAPRCLWTTYERVDK